MTMKFVCWSLLEFVYFNTTAYYQFHLNFPRKVLLPLALPTKQNKPNPPSLRKQSSIRHFFHDSEKQLKHYLFKSKRKKLFACLCEKSSAEKAQNVYCTVFLLSDDASEES